MVVGFKTTYAISACTLNMNGLVDLVWFYGVKCHFQQYFSYIVAVSFIGGGYSIWRNPPTCHKSLTNFIT
jgi:hypothetical protein